MYTYQRGSFEPSWAASLLWRFSAANPFFGWLYAVLYWFGLQGASVFLVFSSSLEISRQSHLD